MELHEIDKKEIFFCIVRMEDEGASLSDCRRHVAAKFGIEIEEVRAIESEGLEKEWPPL
jgi:hypothetical protein